MTQRFYRKASVQVAIVSALALLLVTALTILHQRSTLVQENRKFAQETTTQKAEIQRLETMLTPFRTIALEKFTGPENEALAKLANQIGELQILDRQKNQKIADLEGKLKATRDLAEPVYLNIKSSQLSIEGTNYAATLEFAPTKNERLATIDFTIEVVEPFSAKVIDMAALYHPNIGVAF